jgi:hypothetical protein
MRLCQRLCSSSAALADSLGRLGEGELITPEFRTKAFKLGDAARQVKRHSKLQMLGKLLSEHAERVIVFSEHLPTLSLIKENVEALGRPVVLYQGGLSREDRNRRLKAFRETPNSVFVATRAGTEGLNLQFCNVLVNYELPWNPMVVEQRIGRIHRIGQTRDAYIINLAAEGTIEAHILTLLDQKIRLFELVVGELDVILGDFGGADALEKQLTTAFLSSKDEGEFKKEVDQIGDAITQSRQAGLQQEVLNSDVSGDDNAMQLERDFGHLTIAMRVRLGYGTKHLNLIQGIEARRELLGLHVSEIMEALESAHEGDILSDKRYGSLITLTGVTHRGRAVHLKVKADRLPMLLAELDADAEAPLVPSAA